MQTNPPFHPGVTRRSTASLLSSLCQWHVRCERFLTILFIVHILTISVAARAQQVSPCTIPATAVFEVLLFQAQTTPLRTEVDFAPFQQTLDFYCFKKTSNISWTYTGAVGQVVVTSRPSQRSMSLVLLPSQPARLGDAALAALINRATHISTSDGDGIDLELPSRTTVAKGAEGKLTESLGFRLNGGEWFRTSAFIEWSP
jgi:hypothetical protein